MAQVVPSLTSLPIDSTAAPSVEDIQARLPSICVDYLSHDWAEEDVWTSWRSMTRHKNEIANGVRLENASWRTWWKQRNKLKTISPETLNWLKDSDVTWLYGPLHTAVEPVPPPKIATAEERLGLSRPHGKDKSHADDRSDGDREDHHPAAPAPTKPILKHRTLSEMLSIPTPSSPILEAVHDDDKYHAEIDHSRPTLMHTKSDTNIVTKGHPPVSHPTRPISPPGDAAVMQDAANAAGHMSNGSRTPDGHPNQQSSDGKRHISFNTFVEQCIAIDDPSEIGPTEKAAGTRIDEHDQDQDDEEDEDAVLEMRSGSSASSHRSNSLRSSRPSVSRAGSTTSSQADHITIAQLPPTTLKEMGHMPSPSPQLQYQPTGDHAIEHEAQQRAAQAGGRSDDDDDDDEDDDDDDEDDDDQEDDDDHVNAFGQDASDMVTSPIWDDEDDYSVGFDYFSGPDLGVGDEYDTGSGAKAGDAGSNKRSGPGGAGAAAAASGTRAVQSHVGSGAHYGKGNSGPISKTESSPQKIPGSQTNQARRNHGLSASPQTARNSSPGGGGLMSPPMSPSAGSSPLPGRSILKVRPPGSIDPHDNETSPTSGAATFNWKPSAATGIGGFDQGVRRVIKEPSASISGSLPTYDASDSFFGQAGSGTGTAPGAGSGQVTTPPLQTGTSAPVSTSLPNSPVAAKDGAGATTTTTTTTDGSGESRGRSAVRASGAGMAERSASRGTGTGSIATSSMATTSPRTSTASTTPTSTSSSSGTSTKQTPTPASSKANLPPPPASPPRPSSPPQVQRPIGMGGTMPKDDLTIQKEKKQKEKQQQQQQQQQQEEEASPSAH